MYSAEITIADILKSEINITLQKAKSSVQKKAVNDIINCRTEYFGGHILECQQCGTKKVLYNSCRNRNCPRCGNSKAIVWADNLEKGVLPVKHFHSVFTIPHILNNLFYINQEQCYTMLFKASSEALKDLVYRDYAAVSGAISVIHTWGQALTYHPHIHIIVPAGGLDCDGMQWVKSKEKFLIYAKTLSGKFRSYLIKMLEEAWKKGKLKIPEHWFSSFTALSQALYSKPWNVNLEKPLSNPRQIINYLAKYVNKVAISNSRIVSVCGDKVTFIYKSYKTGEIGLRMTLTKSEFISRFLMHILPKGFYKIRYYGIYAQSNSKLKEICFSLLDRITYLPIYVGLPLAEVIEIATGVDICLCIVCKTGKMKIVFTIPKSNKPYT